MAIIKLLNAFYRIDLDSLVQKLGSKSFHEKPMTNLILHFTPGITNLENSKGGISIEEVFWIFG